VMQVKMPDGRVVEMTREELTRSVRLSIGEKIARAAGVLPTDSEVMRKLKIGMYASAQTGRLAP
jgi:hypothetical protein